MLVFSRDKQFTKIVLFWTLARLEVLDIDKRSSLFRQLLKRVFAPKQEKVEKEREMEKLLSGTEMKDLKSKIED
jgi:hypothetical protein